MIAKDDKKKIYYVKNYCNHFNIFLTYKILIIANLSIYLPFLLY